MSDERPIGRLTANVSRQPLKGIACLPITATNARSASEQKLLQQAARLLP